MSNRESAKEKKPDVEKAPRPPPQSGANSLAGEKRK
jgi:hypothetical protein